MEIVRRGSPIFCGWRRRTHEAAGTMRCLSDSMGCLPKKTHAHPAETGCHPAETGCHPAETGCHPARVDYHPAVVRRRMRRVFAIGDVSGRGSQTPQRCSRASFPVRSGAGEWREAFKRGSSRYAVHAH